MRIKLLFLTLVFLLAGVACAPSVEPIAPIDASEIVTDEEPFATLECVDQLCTLETLEELLETNWVFTVAPEDSTPDQCDRFEDLVFCDRFFFFNNNRMSRIFGVPDDERVLVNFKTLSGLYELRNF